MEQNQNPQQFNTENQQTDNFYQEYQHPVYSPVTVKKRINPAVIIVPIAVLVAAALVVLLIVLLSGNSGYKGAEEKYISQMMGGLSSAFSETEEKISEEPQSLTVKFDVSNSQIADYIGMSNITLVTETAVNGTDVFAHMGLSMGDMLFNGKFWADTENGSVLMSLPELSSIYLQASVAVSEENGQESAVDYEEVMEVLNDIVSNAMDIYFEVVGDVEVVKNQELTVAGNTYKADKAEIKLDAAQFAKVTKEFIESIVNNDRAMDILCSAYGASKQEIMDMLGVEEILEALDEFIEEEADSDAAFEMTVWMKSGNIVGREVKITDDDGSIASAFDFYQIPSSDGTVTYFRADDGTELLNVDKASGDMHSGTLTMSYDEDKVTVDYKNMAVTEKLFQGEAKVTATGSEAFEVTVKLEASGDTKTVLVSIPNVCSVTVTAGPSHLSYEDRPQLSAGQVAVIDSDGDFYEDEAFNQFFNDILSYFIGSNLYY